MTDDTRDGRTAHGGMADGGMADGGMGHGGTADGGPMGVRSASTPTRLADPALLQAFLPRLREGLYVADADGRILDASPALAALLGAEDAAALRGRALDEFVDDPAARREALAALDPGGAAQEVEVELRGAAGARRAAVESVAVVRDASGQVRLLGVVRAGDADAGATAAAGAPGRDALTGCLERTHLMALGARLARDPMVHAGVIIVRLEAGREGAGAPVTAPDVRRQRVARFLMRHVRGDEPIVRLADDEFLIVLADALAEHVERVARRIQLLALRDAPAPLSLGWAARDRGESLAAVVTRAGAARVPVPMAMRADDQRRRGAPDERAAPGGMSADLGASVLSPAGIAASAVSGAAPRVR